MIWITWRQARAELLLGFAILAAIAAFYLSTGFNVTSSYHDSILPTCVANSGGDGCMDAAGAFFQEFDHLTSLVPWLNFLPLVLGILLAAPAVLELESGTYRFAWTQGVSRGRWLLTKIGLGLAAATLVSAALVVMWTWWRGPFDALEGRFESSAFDFEGTVPIAYTLFAFALCLACGALLRRTAPALVISLAAFLVVRLGIENKLRPHYRTPLSMTLDPDKAGPGAGSFVDGNWVLGQNWVDASGRTLGFNDPALRQCIGVPKIDGNGVQIQVKQGIDSCLQDHGISMALVYQPAHRFWLFQGIETAIFLGLAAALLALTVWWVQRRIA